MTRREEQLRALQTQLQGVQAAAVAPQARGGCALASGWLSGLTTVLCPAQAAEDSVREAAEAAAREAALLEECAELGASLPLWCSA